MTKLATLVVAAGALTLAFVTLSPNAAEAGWRRWGWGAGVNVYVGPRYGWYGYRYYRPYAYSGYPYGYYPYWRGRYWRGWYY